MALAPDHLELGRINRSPLLNIPIRWNGSYLFRLLAYIHLEKERFILIYSSLSKLFAGERSTRWNTIY